MNFFNIGGRVHLVDMPGYGYAKAPKDEIKEWNYLIKDYLRGRTVLQRVFVLVDARHGLNVQLRREFLVAHHRDWRGSMGHRFVVRVLAVRP